mgnify:FL=1
MATILVVDDDRKLVDMLRLTLRYEGYQVLTAGDGHAAVATAREQRPDLIVLDWMLPGLDGVGVLKALRGDGAPPVLMLTARDTVADRVVGLDAGADDYLVKPFAPVELLARVRALLRRGPSAPQGLHPLRFSDLVIDQGAHEVWRGSRRIALSPKEYDLLTLFLRHPRQVLRREQILEQVWGYDFGGNGNVLEVYVGYLRSKTEAGGEPRLIHTVRGVGYVLREEGEA